MNEPTDLYATLVAVGIAPHDATRIANAGRPDLEAAIVAVARKFHQVQRALDALENGIVLLRHKFVWAYRALELPQHGQRGKRLMMAWMSLRRMVAIEFGMWRSGRKGGSAGSEAVG